MNCSGAVWSVLMQESFFIWGVIQLACGRLRDKCLTLMILIVKSRENKSSL